MKANAQYACTEHALASSKLELTISSYLSTKQINNSFYQGKIRGLPFTGKLSCKFTNLNYGDKTEVVSTAIHSLEDLIFRRIF